jgi:hypothetical protein
MHDWKSAKAASQHKEKKIKTQHSKKDGHVK